MKKKLVVLLAAVMLFAFSANAYAATFSDVSDQSVIVQDAIKKTVALGIIEGYEDGTFGPDKTITRAEFAKIAVSAAGAKNTATMLEGNNSSFKDVKAGAWYTGWINASESLGIFLGDTNGNFRPNDTITNQEAITVMLRLLGYNDNLTGTWPVNYVTKANQIGILDDVNIVANAAAKRGDIVVMLGDTLDADLVTYDKDTNEFAKKQWGIANSRVKTLLDESFKGSFVEVDGNFAFDAVTQVRDAGAKTLNWDVPHYSYTDSAGSYHTNGSGTFIIDENTAVSYNGGTLFDLEGHQGKIYYVIINDKPYARFIEVKSSIVTTTNDVTINSTDKRVTVQKTKYNTINEPMDNLLVSNNTVGSVVELKNAWKNSPNGVDTWTWSVADGSKVQNSYTDFANSNILLYRNDDDQVYRILVDRYFDETAYFVKSVNTNNVRLIGSKNMTVSMNDADTLIYDGDKFIAPSDLKPGDAIMEITPGDLYVKVNTVEGELNSADRGEDVDSTTVEKRFKIGGKNYVCNSMKWLDDEYEDTGVDTEDVIGNNVTILLNKDNSIAVALVDETTTGNTLYGIVTSGGNTNGDWVTGTLTSLTIYTEEGYTVNYDLDDDLDDKATDSVDLKADNLLGMLVAYKLNNDGEIKEIDVVTNNIGALGHQDDLTTTPGCLTNYPSIDPDGKISTTGKNLYGYGSADKIEIKNNAYITYNSESLALAANVIIFEVDDDGNQKVDVNLVTRSAMLSKSSFEPEDINVGNYDGNSHHSNHLKYFVYDTNTSGAIKVMAYTNASSEDLLYGVVDAWNFRSSQDAHSITFKGDDNVYTLDNYSGLSGNIVAGGTAGAGRLVAYTLSGDNVEIKYVFGKEANMMTNGFAREVSGVTNGLVSVRTDAKNGGLKVMRDYREDNNDIGKPDYTGDPKPSASNFDYYEARNYIYNVMTDTNTLVYVIDATTGNYSEGSVSDISRGDYVYVPVIDSDGYADVVIVDEYSSYGNNYETQAKQWWK